MKKWLDHLRSNLKIYSSKKLLDINDVLIFFTVKNNSDKIYTSVVKQINDLSKVIMMTLHKQVKFVCPEYKYFISEVNHFLCLKNSPKDIGDLSLGKNIPILLHNGPWIWL